MTGTQDPVHEAGSQYALQLSDDERSRYRMMAERARDGEAALWEHAGIIPGGRIADVGCGPGAILVHLAEVAGPSGSVVGVEPDARARAAAEDEISRRGLTNARVVDGDAGATGLEPASFDVVMIRHVLFHLGDRAQAVVRHLARLLRPGGALYMVDTDLTGTRTSPPDADVLDSVARYGDFQQRRGNNIAIGPHLGELLVGAGLAISERAAMINVVPSHLLLGGPVVAAQAEMQAAGVANDADVERWAGARRRFASDPNAVMFMPLYVAVGRRTEDADQRPSG